MKILLAVLTSVLFLSACEFQQDPLADSSPQVKNGNEPDKTQEDPAKLFDKNALQIDAPAKINGRINAALEFKISGRVMVPGINYQIRIDNLADFSGATFDAATGLFKWTPTREHLNGAPGAEIPLRVTLATLPTVEFPVQSTETKEILLIITNSYTRPIINSVTGLGTLIAGQTFKMDVSIEDIDASNTTEITLQPRDCSNYSSKSISQFLQVNKIVPGATPGNYKVELGVNLTNADTIVTGKYCFAIAAVSKFGVVSEVYRKDITVEGKVRDSKITLPANLEVLAGTTQKITFSIYDPVGNGELTLTHMDDIGKLLPGSTWTCQAGSLKSQLDCSALVIAPATSQTISLTMMVDNLNPRVGLKVSTRHIIRINVKAAN